MLFQAGLANFARNSPMMVNLDNDERAPLLAQKPVASALGVSWEINRRGCHTFHPAGVFMP
jgi:hypothetical protein